MSQRVVIRKSLILEVKMKKTISALCLSVVVASTTSASANDVRELFVNESQVQNLSKAPATFSANAMSSSDAVADVVFFYQPSYFAKFGAYEAHKRIAEWVKLTNNSYKAHGLNFRLSIADIVPVMSVPDDTPYQNVSDSDGNIIINGANYLFSIASLNEGNPEFSLYQEKWKGDLVVYVRERRGVDTILGQAGIGGEFASLVDNGIDPSTYTTLAHEIGHALGMNHEEKKAFVGPDYARAWKCAGKYTIMYSSAPEDGTLHHYSTPDLSNGGVACGDEAVANNARIAAENFAATAQRRSGVESLGNVSFTSSTYSGDETNGVDITIERDGDLTQSATVKLFAENNTAEWGVDYTHAFVLAEFAEGESTATVNFPMIKDAEAEGVETLSLSMKFPYRLSVSDAAMATISIADSALVGSAGVFSISGTTELNEGDEGEYVVTRVGGLGEAVLTVSAVSDSAFEGTDFVALNKQLVFAEGEVEKAVSLVTIDNLMAEPIEHFSVEIDSPHDSAEYSTKSVAVSITDNDTSAVPNVGKFLLSTTTSIVPESAGTITLTIERRGGFDGEVTLRAFTTAGTAVAGTDFVAINKDITFADREVKKTFEIQIIDDAIDEKGSNNFEVHIEGDDVEFFTNKVTITIKDNDGDSSGGDKSDSSGGSTSFGFLLLLSLVALLRKSKAS